jgi:O-antigen ligase
MLAVSLGVLRWAGSVQYWGQAERIFKTVCIALLLAGVLSAMIATVQRFSPHLADGFWIAKSAMPGRMGANLRQPNHLSSLLMWATIALVWLHEHNTHAVCSRPKTATSAITFMMLWLLAGANALTASRTGMLCLIVLLIWALLDSHLSRLMRQALFTLPAVYALCWWLITRWSQATGQAFSGSDQLSKADLSSSRGGLWQSTLELIAQHPWWGVGWGEFNFAWSLTPVAKRAPDFFDHTHNLPLQLLVELGLPLGLCVLGLLCWALYLVGKACYESAPGPQALRVRAATLMMLIMVLHSLVEYPLWYAYFLLPTVFLWGLCLSESSTSKVSCNPPTKWPLAWGLAGGLSLMAGTAAVVADYLQVTPIYQTAATASMLQERIEMGQRSTFFAHHAHHTAVMHRPPSIPPLQNLAEVVHFLLDAKLLQAWAQSLHEQGHTEHARHLAQRLKEFNNPQSILFFKVCEHTDAATTSFQCTPPTQNLTFKDFRAVMRNTAKY